jgi:Bacterial Ig-like domain (group 3)
MFAVRFSRLGLGVSLPGLSLSTLLVIAPHLLGQTAPPQLLPYAMTLVAGGGTTATFTPGATCPSGKTAKDKFGDGCLATEVQLDDPRYVTEDSQGNFFISDTKNAIIRRVDGSTGVITLIAGGGTSGSGSSTEYTKGTACGTGDSNTALDYQGDGCMSSSVKLGSPEGLAISPITGDLYFGDITNATVRMIPATNGLVTGPGIITNVAGDVSGTKGTFGYEANTSTSTVISATGGALDDPYGVTFDKNGILYIAEEDKTALLVVNTSSAPVTIATISIPPGTIAKIAGFDNAAHGDFCPNGTSGTTGCGFGAWVNGANADVSLMNDPIDITVDPSGNVFFANNFSSDIGIGKVTTQGIISTYAGLQAIGTVGSANTRAQANTIPIGSPYGVAADANGNLYVSDSTKGWVWRVDAANQGIYVIAGGGTSCNATASGDGCTANDTKFSTGTAATDKTSGLPYASAPGVGGLYADSAGSLIVADATLGLIHKIVTNADFGTILATNPSQTIDIHFGVKDGPGGTPYTLTTNPANFSIGAATCTANSDNTTDCTLPLTATPTQTTSGAFSSTLHIASALGMTADIPLTGTLDLNQVASSTVLTLSSNDTNPVAPVTITAVVSSTTTSVPITGTVTFYNNGKQIGTTQTIVKGQASIQYTFPAGTYSITATYGGSQFFLSSTSTANPVTSVIPAFTITPLKSTVTVAQGQTAANSIALISSGNYAGTVAFACSGLPANATCLFNPSPVAVGAGGATVALSILTSGPGSSAVRPLALPGSHGGQVIFACLPGAALLLLITRRRTNGKLSISLLLLTVLIGGTAFLSGCSGGTKTAPSTATGTSTLTITATGTPNVVSTGTNIVQTISLTLAVTSQP